MSLYDGLDLGEEGKSDTKTDVSGWGSRMKLLESQKQLQAKKAQLVQKKKPAPSTTMAPVIDLKRRNDELPLHFNQLTGRLERMTTPILPGSPFIGNDMPNLAIGPDEYDPFRPNEYEEFVKKRKTQRMKEREEERKKESEERERRRKERHKNDDDEEVGEMERMRRRHEEDEDDDRPSDRSSDRSSERSSRAGAAIAPPMSLIESDKVAEAPSTPRGANGKDMATPGYGALGSVASKIMARMGYKHGQGLGKTEQGMSTALQVEKTSKRGGKIIHEKDVNVAVTNSPQRTDTSNASLLANPSKVILLLNMVGPGEVDADLEPETAEECAKYGKVAKCVIYEITNGADDEAVRIFIEFEKIESATKALIDLNGRYFGGRVVKASFYDLQRFRSLDLVDPTD